MQYDYIEALDLARDGNWLESHKIVQQYNDKLSCLIHAYLHRQEGDLNNANYWYRRAGVEMPATSLEEELKHLYTIIAKEKEDK